MRAIASARERERTVLTYEQLIVYIDSIAPQLPGCGLRLLWRLVAIGIKSGSNEIRISLRTLAADMGVKRDSITVGARSLAPDVQSVFQKGLPATFILPESWFSPQRSLFVMPDAVENDAGWPDYQATGGPITRPLVARLPGQGGPITRPGGPITRPPFTQNQQLTDDPLDRSNRVLSSVGTSLNPRDSIEGVNHLPVECVENAEKLKRWLRDYFGQHHRSHNPPQGPDDVILAKCLAIAPLASLAAVLRTLDKKRTSPGDSWAWFVTVFCSRIHRTRELDKVPAPPAFRVSKQTPSSEGNPNFASELLHQAAASVRTM